MYPFERFTDEAKRALTLAQEEAERSRGPYIGTEHLLLGLLRVEHGRGAEVVRSLGVSIEAVRSAIDTLQPKNERAIRGLVPTSVVKKVIELAFEEARRAGDLGVGTEHLLLGILVEADSGAAHVLANAGVTVEKVREQLSSEPLSREVVSGPAALTSSGSHHAARGMTPDDGRLVGEVLARAIALAGERREGLGTEHFLLALAEQGSSRAGEILQQHGLSRPAIEKILAGPPAGESPP